MTRKRWPNGVAGQPFFEKNAPQGTPDWVRTVRVAVPGSTKAARPSTSRSIDGLADLVWTGQPGRAGDPRAAVDGRPAGRRAGPGPAGRRPRPGRPAGLAECTEVAFAVRERVAHDGLTATP